MRRGRRRRRRRRMKNKNKNKNKKKKKKKTTPSCYESQIFPLSSALGKYTRLQKR